MPLDTPLETPLEASLDSPLDIFPGAPDIPAPEGADQPREVLFRSRDLLVARAGGFSPDCCVVTFTSFTDDRTLDRVGFAEDFLRSRRIDAVHVISRDNDWYQYEETEAAMARVRAATRPYRRVVTYGSSMGAYAAIRLAGLAGAHAALAMSPQYSVVPATVPFEHRWDVVARRVRPVWEGRLPFPDLAEAYVFYDPLDIDSQHAVLIAARCRTTEVRLRGAGHQTAGFLLEAGMLQDVVLDACRGPLDVPALEREAWRRRRQAPQHWLALAARVRFPAWRVALLRRAYALAPGSAAVLGQLGVTLGRAGRFAEALEAHREALELAPGHLPFLSEYAATLDAGGDHAGALAVLDGIAGQPGAEVYEPQAVSLRRRLGIGTGSRRPAWGRGRRRVAGSDPGVVPAVGAEPVVTEPGQRGYALFGPYLELRPGRYAVDFTVSARPGPVRSPPGRALERVLDRRIACILDVTIHGGRTVLARRELSTAALRAGGGRFRLAFRMPEWTICEFRVRATGAVGLVVQPARPCRRLADGPAI